VPGIFNLPAFAQVLEQSLGTGPETGPDQRNPVLPMVLNDGRGSTFVPPPALLPTMKIGIGAGYVGGPTMAVITDLSRLPVYEPDLDAVVGRCRGRNLHFPTAVEEAIALAYLVVISVNTPTKTKGLGAGQACDLKWVGALARTLAKAARGHTIAMEKSTLPVRTAAVIQEILASAEGTKSFAVLSNPEFLAEGTAIADLENPDQLDQQDCGGL
jgi:UDPglucose 6-dehydrogenase